MHYYQLCAECGIKGVQNNPKPMSRTKKLRPNPKTFVLKKIFPNSCCMDDV